MTALFETVLRATLSGSVVIVAVLALRLLLKRVPKKYICLLWLLAALRMLMPFEIESVFSLQPALGTVTIPGSEYAQSVTTDFNSGVGEALQPSVTVPDGGKTEQNVTVDLKENAHVYEREVPLRVTILENYDRIIAWSWLAVAAAMLGYIVVSYLRLRSRVRDAVILREGVWVSRRTESPFVMGFFRPRIYLTPDLSEKEMEYVLAHERCHIRRGDHWWKLLGFVTLAVHWFNPLVWLAYVLLCRDLEMACDEAVVKHMEVGERKAYSAALLSCSAKGRTITACPVAFGETSVKSRIQNVLNYRKPKFWVILVAVIAIVVVAVCFLTVPPEQEIEGEPLNVEGGSRWGITASCAAPSATGIEFRFVQNDDSIPGELFYGQEYTLEKWDGDAWVAVSPIIDNWAFTAEAILLPKNTTTVVDIDWEWLYGEVSDGYYRLSKTLWLDQESYTFHVYFSLGEDYEGQNSDVTQDWRWLAQCRTAVQAFQFETVYYTTFEGESKDNRVHYDHDWSVDRWRYGEDFLIRNDQDTGDADCFYTLFVDGVSYCRTIQSGESGQATDSGWSRADNGIETGEDWIRVLDWDNSGMTYRSCETSPDGYHITCGTEYIFGHCEPEEIEDQWMTFCIDSRGNLLSASYTIIFAEGGYFKVTDTIHTLSAQEIYAVIQNALPEDLTESS